MKLNFNDLQKTLSGTIPGLDALRGIAILWIVWQNSCGNFELTDFVSKLLALFTNTGWLGVQLFLVLSGFLITGILINEKGSEFQLRNFYLRRILRIFPVYYLVLFVFFIILPLMGDVSVGHPVSAGLAVQFWTFSVNWALIFFETDNGLEHLWSLAIIVQFYLIWPLLVLNLSPRSLLACCLALVVLAIVSRFAITYVFPELYVDYNYTFTIARMDALAIGAILAIVVRNKIYFKWLKGKATAVLVLALTLIFVILGITEEFSAVDTGIGQFNQTLSAIVFAMSIYYLLQPATFVYAGRFRITSIRWLNKVGRYSYAIYVFHLPIKEVWRSLIFISPEDAQGMHLLLLLFWNSASVFIASYLLALVSWHLIEAPILNLKRLFRPSRNVEDREFRQ